MPLTKEIRKRILDRVRFCYGAEQAEPLCGSIEILIAAYQGCGPARARGWSEKDALLITYADSVVSMDPPLETLRRTLLATCGRQFSFVHLLPFFPYSSDDGFSVTDYRAIRPDLGTWGEVHALSRDYRLVFDGVINHVSQHSQYVRGDLAGDPAYKDFALSLPKETDTRSVLRTRNLPLLHDYPSHDGTRYLWTTFSRDQVDLNWANPKVLLEMVDVMLFYASRGASMLRLDAIPYLWKRLGTSCAHLPETHELIKLIRDIYDAAAPGMLLLTETNVPHPENVSYFGQAGDEAQVIYNFSLAPLIVWSLLKGDAKALSQWASGVKFVSPRATYLNITATHDGIGMRPTEGLLSEEARKELCDMAKARGGDITGKRNADGSISPYELNLSYFDAINDPRADEPQALQVKRFLCSQAIPMSFIGMPGLYIHSLFGSRNDYGGVKQSGRARSINRAQLQERKLLGELADPGSLRNAVFQGILRMLKIRAEQPAFHPDAPQTVLDCGASVFALLRESPAQRIMAFHNISGKPVKVPRKNFPLHGSLRDLLDAPSAKVESDVELAPYQIRWITGD